MRWTNELQEAILHDWTEGCKNVNGKQPLRILRKRIARKYDLSVHVVQGIIELGATQGLTQESIDYGKKYYPVNYHLFIGDLKERVEALERKFNLLLEGIEKVLESGTMVGAHVSQLRGMAKWMQKRDAIEDLEEPPRRAIPHMGDNRELDGLQGHVDNAQSLNKEPESKGLLFQEITEGKKAATR